MSSAKHFAIDVKLLVTPKHSSAAQKCESGHRLKDCNICCCAFAVSCSDTTATSSAIKTSTTTEPVQDSTNWNTSKNHWSTAACNSWEASTMLARLNLRRWANNRVITTRQDQIEKNTDVSGKRNNDQHRRCWWREAARKWRWTRNGPRSRRIIHCFGENKSTEETNERYLRVF